MVSLSLLLGILVSDLSGLRLLTTASAQTNSCGQTGGATVISDFVEVDDVLALRGITVRGVIVNGRVLERAVVLGGVRINGGSVYTSNGVLVSDGAMLEGVLVSDGSPASETSSVPSGEGGPCLQGVLVSDGSPVSTNGVLVSDGVALDGVLVSDGLMADGGTLTGDNLTVSPDGVVTGQNLQLTGTTLTGHAVSLDGTVSPVRRAPPND